MTYSERNFFNLSREKQQKIIKAARDEFTQHGFDLSSIQRIIEASEISRVNFYKYFEDKNDIYGVVITETKDLTFDNLEDMIFEISQNITCKVFEKALTDIDSYRPNKGERGKLKNTGKGEKYFPTRYQERCAKTQHLLDEALRIVKNQCISLSRARIECFLIRSFLLPGGSRGYKAPNRWTCCHESIRQSVIKESKLIIENQEKKLRQMENLNYKELTQTNTN